MNLEKHKPARAREQERTSRWRGNGRAVSRAEWALLAALMVIPAWACWNLSATIQPRFLIGYLAVIWTITMLVYRHDKKRAISGGWRTPESTLHLLELLGGWPGAFVAQRIFRHKTSKRSFQITFWFVVALHHYACFDFVNHWRYSAQAARALAQLPQLVFG